VPRFPVAPLALAALLLAAPAWAQNWLPTGPPGGAVRALAADPRDPARLYLGTADGNLYRSEDDGRNWTLLRPGFPLRGRSLDQVVVDPKGVVLVGYWTVGGPGGGVARSVDGGQHFKLLEDVEGESVRALALAPSDRDCLAAGSLTGVFVSRDGGGSWSRITPPGDPDLRNIESLAFDPADAHTLYAGTWHLGWKTTELGATWTPLHDGMIDDSDVMTLTVDRQDPRTLYATACTGVYRASVATERWTKFAGIPEPSRRTRAFAQDPDRPERLLAGTTKGLWTSDDGGTRWRLATPDTPIVNAVLAQAGGTVLLGTEDAGVPRSDDGGRTWLASNGGFSDRFVSRLLFDPDRRWVFAADAAAGAVFVAAARGGPWTPLRHGLAGRRVLSLARVGGTILAGTDDGIFALNLRAVAWRRFPTVVAGKPAHPRVRALLALAPRRVLAATGEGVMVRTDGGTTWTIPAAVSAEPALDLVACPGDARCIVAATSAGFYRSEDAGDTWALVATLPQGATPHALVAAPGARTTLFATTTLGLFRSDDLAGTWRRVGGGLPATDVCGLAVHPDGRTLYVSDFARGDLYKSADGGAHWERMATGDLPSDHVWAIGLDPDEPERVFTSSASGLFVLEPRSVDADTP